MTIYLQRGGSLLLFSSVILLSIGAANAAEERAQLEIIYGDNIVVQTGKPIKQLVAREQPQVKIQADDSKYHTLIMFDPDAPDAADPFMAKWVHWMVTNIEKGDLSSGRPVLLYMAPLPAKGTGAHRYMFHVYEHDKPLHVVTPSNRGRFDLEGFRKLHSLGAPVATEYFTAQNPDKLTFTAAAPQAA